MTRTAKFFAAAIAATASVISSASVNAQSEDAKPTLAAPQEGQQLKAIAGGSYYSPRLKARFLLQQMSIPGHNFWGARIVDMDWNSPLRNIGLNVGDVVTRLDGVRVSTGMYQQNDFSTGMQFWAIPQMEKHYSFTHVRFIRTGTTMVQQLTTDLGPLNNWGGGGGGIPGGGGIAP